MQLNIFDNTWGLIIMEDSKKDWDDIEVNRRDGEEVLFESELVQSAYNHIKFFRKETNKLLQKLDSKEFKQQMEEFDIDEFSEDVTSQIFLFIDNMYDMAEEAIPFEDIPEFVDETTLNAKRALNRDADYIRKAKRKLQYLNSDAEIYNKDKINLRVIELCDKAIEVNRNNYEAYYLKGIAKINLKNYDEGIDELINAMVIRGDSIDIRLEIANANRLSGEYGDAIDVYDSVLEMQDDSFEAFKGKAYTYFDWEKYNECDMFFEKANLIQSLDEDSMYKWIICCNKLENYDKADDLLKKLKS